MTDIVLDILNLSKTEVVSIDVISNQEFTEVVTFADTSFMYTSCSLFYTIDVEYDSCC